MHNELNRFKIHLYTLLYMYANKQNKEYSVLGERIRRLGLHISFDFFLLF